MRRHFDKLSPFDKLRMHGHFDKLSPFDKLRMHGHFDKLSANGGLVEPLTVPFGLSLSKPRRTAST